MKILVLFGIAVSLFCLIGCNTYSINLIHTQGEADDVVDDTQRVSPQITTDFQIPFSPLS